MNILKRVLATRHPAILSLLFSPRKSSIGVNNRISRNQQQSMGVSHGSDVCGLSPQKTHDLQISQLYVREIPANLDESEILVDRSLTTA